ncbi:hypothetical protein [Pseudomonas sp. GM25]|uniref:hypothetical protein n=1 Tax=Pseudomonas sp. GM25 TaxID=1144327 RepID=UPI0009DAEA02|nr:hypothetical protein [Pseudomonas sp. GM25]
MKKIYDLAIKLNTNPAYMEKVQALTLNSSKPLLGLKGTYGLFGSKEWWTNIENNAIPQTEIEGTIVKVYRTGQDNIEKQNTIDIITTEQKIHTEGMYANNEDDKTLYKEGAKVKIKYAHEPLKNQPAADGSQNNANTILEISISV